MPPLRPIVEPPSDRPRAADLKGLEQLAWLMDRAFGIPGTSIRVGLDAILGLLPVGGDFLTGLVQVGIVLFAIFHYRVPRAVAARMALNVLLDVAIGAIPLVGDAFDVFFKANTKNIQLLSRVEEQRRQNVQVSSRSSIAFLIAIAAVLLLVLGLVLVGFVTVVRWLLQRPLV
jgi:hypothetical protein